MRIEINPRSLLNLESFCEVIYKLHPSVLDYLVEMERSLGKILGFIDLNNTSLEDYSSEPVLQDVKITSQSFDNKFNNPINKIVTEEYSIGRLLKKIEDLKQDKNSNEFNTLRKYLQLDTDEYIPIKIYVEVEDPIIGKTLKELVRALEKNRASEKFYFNKKEIDENAHFAEGYGLSMNKEQRKKYDDLYDDYDVEAFKELLRKEKLFP